MMYFVLFTPNLGNVPAGIRILRLPGDEVFYIRANEIKQMILTERKRGYKNLYDTSNPKEPALWICCAIDIDPSDTKQSVEIERVPIKSLARWIAQKKAA